MKKIILMAPSPLVVSGGIAGWTKRFIENCTSEFSVSLVDESVKRNQRKVSNKYKHHYFYEIKRTIGIWKDLKKRLKDDKNDQIVVHCCIPSLKFAMLRELHSLQIAHRHGAKFIFHFRSTIPTCANTRFSKFLLRKVLKKTDGIVVLNSLSYDYLISLMKKNVSDKIAVIPNFVAESEIIARKTIKDSVTDVVYTGFVSSEKGCDTLILVAKMNPGIMFHFVGKVSSDIQKIFDRERLDNVVFEGEKTKTEIYHLYDGCDVFCFLSRQKDEGFSNALTEAMARGMPCIVTDWAANKDQIGDFANQLIADPHDPVSCDAILKRISSKEERTKISRYNIERAASLYSSGVVMEQYYAFYEKLLNEEKIC